MSETVNNSPVLVGEQFTWSNWAEGKTFGFGQTYTLTEAELSAGIVDPDGDETLTRFDGLNDRVGDTRVIGSAGGADVILKLESFDSNGERVYSVTVAEVPEDARLFSDTITFYNLNFATTDGVSKSLRLSPGSFTTDLDIGGRVVNSRVELVGEQFTWASFFEDKQIVSGGQYVLTEAELSSGKVDPDGDDTLTRFDGLNDMVGDTRVIGKVGSEDIILTLTEFDQNGDRVYTVTIPSGEFSGQTADFYNVKFATIEDPASYEDTLFTKSLRLSSGSYSETIESTSLIEAGVEGVDFWYDGAISPNFDQDAFLVSWCRSPRRRW